MIRNKNNPSWHNTIYHSICKYCNISFSSTHKHQKYCSISCGVKQRAFKDPSIFANGFNSTNVYLLGLIYSDGCLSWDNRSKYYKIDISMNDKEHIESIRKIMSPERKLYINTPKKGKLCYKVISTNQEDVEFLLEHGVVERKSNVITLPTNVPKKYMHHFIRGYFDGDGCITYTKKIYPRISFACGSKIFLEQLKEYINNNYFKFNTKILTDRRGNNRYVLTINKKEEVLKFYNMIYKDKTFFLDRKYNKFKELGVV